MCVWQHLPTEGSGYRVKGTISNHAGLRCVEGVASVSLSFLAELGVVSRLLAARIALLAAAQ